MTATRAVCPQRPRRISAIRFVLAIACAAAFCGIAAAQGGGWAAIEGISPGSRVEVRLSPHGTAKGTIATVSASGMDIEKSNGSIRHIARAQIAKVYLVGKSHRLRGGLIGAAAGGAAGAVFGYAVAFNGYNDDLHPPVRVDRRAAWAALGALVIGAVGAVIGAVIGSRRSKTLVYQQESDRVTNPSVLNHKKI